MLQLQEDFPLHFLLPPSPPSPEDLLLQGVWWAKRALLSVVHALSVLCIQALLILLGKGAAEEAPLGTLWVPVELADRFPSSQRLKWRPVVELLQSRSWLKCIFQL